METSRTTFRAFATYRGPATRRSSNTSSNCDADADDSSSEHDDAMAEVNLTPPPQTTTSSRQYETARTTTVATSARGGVPRVPSSRNSASRNTNATNVTNTHPSSRRERLMRLLHKIRNPASQKTGGRPQDLARAMLAQESPLLFHAHLIEVVQALSHHPQNKEMAKVLDAVASALPTTTTTKQQKPPISAAAIRALLALETLTHNCPETFADLFLGHAAIHGALRAMLDTDDLLDADDLRAEARAIAKRVLDWSEYSRSQAGLMIRKWCKRTAIDAVYQSQLKALHQSQVKATCSLCQMSKWEWLADVEEAAVTIQAHFRAYRVRTQIAKRAHYHHLGPYTSRVFPHYRRNAPSLEDHQAKASRAVHPLPGEQGRVQRRTTTSSSISTVGESLMAQLPLETVYLEERTDFEERARRAVRTFVDQGRMGEDSPATTPKQRTTDSDYDSGTEYSAATRVTVKPRSYVRHSRRKKASSSAGVSAPDHIRAIHHHVEKVASPKTIFVRE